MKPRLFFLGALLLLTLSCGGEETLERITLNINDVHLEVEVADTPEKREKGLMHREFLDADQGMLFIFDQERQVSFWMKDTLIPLSVAYISKSGHIREIHDLEPRSLRPVRSSYSVLYALEVNKGFFEEKDIGIGDQVIFP